MLLLPAFMLAFGLAAAISNNTDEWCGVTISDEAKAAAEAEFMANRAHIGERAAASAPIIQVYWNIIYATGSPWDGNLSDSQIQQQIALTNRHFNRSIVFNLAGITRTKNLQWFERGHEPSLQEKMKNSLRKGGARTLNVYSVSFRNTSLTGLATLPGGYRSAPKLDGVIVRHTTVAGGDMPNPNKGGCSGNGDWVDDTPPEASAAGGCPKKRDTCPGGGPDPIHNFMDGVNAACAKEFTPGQMSRAIAQIAQFRKET